MTQDEPDVVTKLSPHPVADTVAKLTGMISAKGMKLFAVIDQSAEASQAGLKLRDTTLVIFGSPAAGTPVMVASPLAALDLPLKVLVWNDDGRTKVTYYDPAAIASRHTSAPTWPGTWSASTPSPTHSSPPGHRRCPSEDRPRPTPTMTTH